MYPMSKTLIGLAAATAVALPSSAQAHDRSSPASVNAHVRSADEALDRVAGLVAAHEDAAAGVAFARNRLETARAQREAAAVTRRNARRGSSALRAVVRQHDRNAEGYADLLDEAQGAMQLQAAKAVAASAKNRDRALAELGRLADSLPERARAGIGRATAAVMGDADEELATLTATLSSSAVSSDAKPWIEMAVAQTAAGLASAASMLESLIPTLPEAAQTHVQAALERVLGADRRLTELLGMPGGQGDAGSGVPIPLEIPLPGGLTIPALP